MFKKKLQKYKKIYNILSWIRLGLFWTYYKFFMLVFSIVPVKNRKVMIVSFAGKGYGDNGKYLVKELLKIDDVDIYWAADEKYKDTIPDPLKYVKFNSISFLYHLATSKIWINNSRFYFGIRKRKNQFYIQIWHSTLRLKKIEKDAGELLTSQLISTCKADSRMINLMVSGCEFSTSTYKNSFWYNGEVLNCGTPRCDLFFDQTQKKEIRNKILDKYDIPQNKKVVLYAPTFRKKSNEEDVYLDCEKFSSELGEEYTVLVRMHPISKYKVKSTRNIINVTDYPDMQELIASCDFLVTDYSGCCFDMMINGNPCILYTKDLEEYLEKERNLYFDFKELPFQNVNNEMQLIQLIKNFDYGKYLKKVKEFSDRVMIYENGKASKTICKIIREKMSESEKV